MRLTIGKVVPVPRIYVQIRGRQWFRRTVLAHGVEWAEIRLLVFDLVALTCCLQAG